MKIATQFRADFGDITTIPSHFCLAEFFCARRETNEAFHNVFEGREARRVQHRKTSCRTTQYNFREKLQLTSLDFPAEVAAADLVCVLRGHRHAARLVLPLCSSASSVVDGLSCVPVGRHRAEMHDASWRTRHPQIPDISYFVE